MSLVVPKVLLVGVGRFGRMHLAEWRGIEHVGLARVAGAVVATEESRQRLQAEERDLDVRVGLVGEWWRGIDAVDIAAPTATHAQLVESCLPHAHVLVEKPLANTPEECLRLGALAKRHERVLMVGHVYRWHPVVARLREIVAGMPERPRALRGVLVNPREIGSDRLDPNLEMLHLFDIVDFLFGEQPEVCVGRRRDDTHTISLRYPGPMHAVFRIGWEGSTRIRRLEFLYASQTIRCDLVDNVIEIATRPDQVEKEIFGHRHVALGEQLRGFVAALARPSMKVPDAEVAARVVDVAYRSTPRPVAKRPRVAVIGGGIFGATAALELAKSTDVVLFERHPELLTEVSYFNQWRHHSGFHYPRSYDTIQEIKASKGAFEAEYDAAIIRSHDSYYCTARSGVEIPSERYLAALKGNNLNFQIASPPGGVIDHSRVDAIVRTDEAVYDLDVLRELVRRRLSANRNIRVELGTSVEGGTIGTDGSKHLEVRTGEGPSRRESFDFLVNATYSNLNLVAKWFGFQVEPLRFDWVEILVLRIPIPQVCLTVIDGPFTSLVGTGRDDLFLLSHIHDSVLASVITEDGLPPTRVHHTSNRENMLRHSRAYFPVLDRAAVVESRIGLRAVNAYARDFDARPTVVRSHGFGIWSVLGGKILTCVTNARDIAADIAVECGRARPTH